MLNQKFKEGTIIKGKETILGVTKKYNYNNSTDRLAMPVQNYLLVIRPFTATNILTKETYCLNRGDKVKLKKYDKTLHAYKAVVNKNKIHLTTNELNEYLLKYKWEANGENTYYPYFISKELHVAFFMLDALLISESFNWNEYIANGKYVKEPTSYGEEPVSDKEWKEYWKLCKYSNPYLTLKPFLVELNELMYKEIFIYLQDLWIWGTKKALKRSSKYIINTLNDMMNFLANNADKEQCMIIVKKYAALIQELHMVLFKYGTAIHHIQNSYVQYNNIQNKKRMDNELAEMAKKEKYSKELSAINAKLYRFGM